MTEEQPAACPAPWCGKERTECSHVECWRRVVVTAAPGVPCDRVRLSDEYVPPDER